MSNFGFLHSAGGFQFTVLDACKAEGIDLSQACNLKFGPNHDLVAIGNVTRGTLKPYPGIAGIGIWFAMMIFFAVILIALVFVTIEILTRSTVPSFAYFKDSPVNNPHDPSPGRRKRSVFRQAGRTFVLGVADTQTIFVGAFLLSFAGQTKCQLTSYHFTVAVNQSMICLSVITFSVALVRTYWRNPLAAAFRLLLSVGAFTGVGLTIFRKANYAPDWPPPATRKDSAILLPVACLLESTLRSRAQEQARESQSDLGFGNIAMWPAERFLFIAVAIAFVIAHISIPVRYFESRDHAPQKWTRFRSWFTITYWPYMLIPPTFSSVWCWVRVYQTRKWVSKSGWIGEPNPEMTIWDTAQLIAMGLLITVVMGILTEAMKREQKYAEPESKGAFHRLPSGLEEQSLDSYSLAYMKHDARTNYQGY